MKRYILFLISLFFILNTIPSFAKLETGIEYQIPIDYTKLDAFELREKADYYYNLATEKHSKIIDNNMTNALVLYTILTKKFPDDMLNFTRLGVLYDYCEQDTQAKRNFNRAISEDSTRPIVYYYYGNFFYKRSMFKKALKMYKDAYKKDFDSDYQTNYQIGDIYVKLGDTEASLKYLNKALEIDPNEELLEKISEVEQLHQINKVYYSNTAFQLIER